MAYCVCFGNGDKAMGDSCQESDSWTRRAGSAILLGGCCLLSLSSLLSRCLTGYVGGIFGLCVAACDVVSKFRSAVASLSNLQSRLCSSASPCRWIFQSVPEADDMHDLHVRDSG